MVLTAAVNLRLKTIKGDPERGVSGWASGHDRSELWTQQACVGAREEQSHAQARRGNILAVTFRDALDKAVQTKSAQVIGHSAHGVMGWVQAQQWSQ